MWLVTFLICDDGQGPVRQGSHLYKMSPYCTKPKLEIQAIGCRPALVASRARRSTAWLSGTCMCTRVVGQCSCCCVSGTAVASNGENGSKPKPLRIEPGGLALLLTSLDPMRPQRAGLERTARSPVGRGGVIASRVPLIWT